MAELITRDATEADYNAQSRSIQLKLDVYFNGLSAAPLEITKDNYLIDSDILEEACADDNNPFGKVSANEISFSLFNETGIFNPTNARSPYYGRIRVGVPIKAYMRPSVDDAEINWDELGTFYVSDWSAAITGTSAYVTASDKMYDVFSLPQPKMPVRANVSMHDAFKSFFAHIGVGAVVDERLTEMLAYAYNTSKNADFLNALSVGSQAFVFCNRQGVPTVKYARAKQDVAYTLTDADQIISVSSKQSALLEYDGAEVVMNEPQLTKETVILSMTDLVVTPGTIRNELISFSATPVAKLLKASFIGTGKVQLSNLVASSVDLSFNLVNDGSAEATGDLTVYGSCIESVSSTFAGVGNNLLSVDNIYIQKKDYAEKFYRFLRAYVTNNVPVLDLTIRGNPKYQPGDKLRIVSEKYNIDYTGILLRQQFTYNGALSSTIKVFNSQILEVS